MWVALSDLVGSVICQWQSVVLVLVSMYKYLQAYSSYLILYTRSLSVQAQYSKLFPISSSFRYNGSLVTWTVVCLIAAKFKPLILLRYPDSHYTYYTIRKFSFVGYLTTLLITRLYGVECRKGLMMNDELE
jgi:hypothetical protein